MGLELILVDNHLPPPNFQYYVLFFILLGEGFLGFHLLYCFFLNMVQASQSGYGVDYATQGAQGGFPGSFMNPNSQTGYSHFGSGNEFMSQVGLFKFLCPCLPTLL